ncbi:MAG: flagellar basal-body rod protein FlgF [Deltaproteobacteria bacterium]|nr:flagellar basal-body rod protein FlgF [Deltaproteobacteria bacterium]MBW2069705.1 flagellar basal-body rod protein FlgF [Deltaproteobacteria bacterium]
MISGIYEAINGSLNEELQLSIISNNLANINVPGYKKDRLSFHILMRDQLRQMNGEQAGAEVIQDQQLYRRFVSVQVDTSQGTLKYTGNPLDLAISGRGFFKISTDYGIRYTRKGTFQVNGDSMLVTSDGGLVLGKNGPINIPEGEISVDKTGQITVDGDAIDTLEVVVFDNPEYLQKEGGSLFRATADMMENRPSETETSIEQGYVEEANVKATAEMVRMLETVRAYESYQKIIRALHEINSKAINDFGRLR